MTALGPGALDGEPVRTAAVDSLTILRAPPSLVLAKQIFPDRTVAYGQAKHFDVETVPLRGLDDIATLLSGLIGDPRAAVIRGQLIDPRKKHHVRRLLYADAETGEAATFRDVPREWLALDIEGIARPPDLPAADLAGCAAVALRELPAAFTGVRCIVQASASHAIKPDIRLRMWFWLARPTTGDELKRWLAGTPADPAVLGSVQLTFTARPVFLGGAVDPLPHRLAELPGAARVAVPSPAALARPPDSPRVSAPREPLPEAVADRFVERVLERVRRAPDGQRHATLRGAAVSLGGIQDRAGFTDAEATRWLLDALNVPSSRGKDTRTVVWGLANGRTRPIALEIKEKTRNGGDNSAIPPSLEHLGAPKRHPAGQTELARRGVHTALPFFYPALLAAAKIRT